MPRHPRRHGVSRLVLPAALGAIAFVTVGFVVTGTLFPPASAGEVGAVEAAISGSSATRPDAGSGPLASQVPSALVAAVQPRLDLLDARRHVAVEPGLTPPSSLTGYSWPIPNGRITLPFGPSSWGTRVVAGEAFHDGLDLATFCGDRIVAAHAGVVVASGRHFDVQMGWIGDLTPYLDRLDANGLWPSLPIVVVIDDGNGYRSIYAHLSKAVVRTGQTVAGGEFIGYEGQTGHASGCHLHYGLFSPQDGATFGIDPGIVDRMKLPAWEIARVDPMLVLPERASDKAPAPEPATLTAGARKAALE